MKKFLSVFLALAMLFSLCVPVLATGVGDQVLRYSLDVGGEYEITVATGDVITVNYVVTNTSEVDSALTRTTQDEIKYDHHFFDLIENSLKVNDGTGKDSAGEDVVTVEGATILDLDLTSDVVKSNPVDTDEAQTHYVLFNSTNVEIYPSEPLLIGTFKLKVIAEEGTSVVENTTFFATDQGNSDEFGKTKQDLTVTIGGGVEKITPTVGTAPTATVTFGDTVDSSVIADGMMKDGSTIVPGTWAWKSDVSSYGDATNGTPKTLKAVFTPTDTTTYKSVEVDVNVTVGKADQNPTVTPTKTLYVGGNTLDLSTLVASGTYFGSLSFEIFENNDNAAALEDGKTLTSTENSGTVKIIVMAAGDANHNEYTSANDAITVTVSSKSDANVTISGAADKTYGDSNYTLTATAANKEQSGGAWTWSVGDSGTFEIVSGEGTDSITVKILKANTAGATITATYEDATYAGSEEVTVKVAPKALTITSVDATDRHYEAGNTAVGLTGGELVGVVGEDEVGFDLGTGTVSAEFGEDLAVTTNIQLTGEDKDNYTLTQPSGIKVTITKTPAALSTDIGEKTFIAGSDDWTEFTFTTTANDDLGVMVYGGSDFGTNYESKIAALEYKQGDSWIDMKGQNFGGATGFPMTDATSTFRVKFTADAAGEYSFTAAMKKAEDDSVVCTLDVPFTVQDKATPALTADAYTGTYTGSPVSVDSITGKTAKVDDTVVEGAWAWKEGTEVTSVTDSGEKTLVFTPTDTNKYKPAEKTINVTINKADPTYEVPTGLTATYGQTLADVTLPTGWSWMEDTASVGDAAASAKTFRAKFTPNDTANYNVTENVNVNVNVNQAAAKTNVTGNVSVYWGADGAQAVTVDLFSAFDGVAGAAIKSVSEKTDTNNLIANCTGDSYALGVLTNAAKGKTATLNVVISSTNYEDTIAELTVTIIDKTPVEVTLDNMTVTYGDAVSPNATVTGPDGFAEQNNCTTYTYYTDEACTEANKLDTAPKNAGTYYVKAVYEDSVSNNNGVPGYIGSTTAKLTIKPKELGANDLQYIGDSITKTYDGTTSCTLSGTVTVKSTSLVPGDELTITGTAVYNDEDVLDATKVVFTPNAIGNSNYCWAEGTVKDIAAEITKLAISISGVTTTDRAYDGTKAVTLNGGSLVGVLSGDTAKVSFELGEGEIGSADAADAVKAVTTNIQLTGDEAGNYSLTQPEGLTVTISKKELTIVGMDATTRAYEEGNTTVALSGGTLVGVVKGETISLDMSAAVGTMNDADAGENKPVTVSGVAITGAKAGNYSLTQPADVKVTINRAAQAAPTTVTGAAPTGASATDGKLTGLTTGMEYKKAEDEIWTVYADEEGEKGDNLGNGTYLVRFKEDKNHEPGKAATVVLKYVEAVIPVSGVEVTKLVDVKVSGTDAELLITPADLGKLETVIAETTEDDFAITVDLTNPNGPEFETQIDSVTIPETALDAIVEAAAGNSSKATALEIKMSDGSAVFDADALAEIKSQAGDGEGIKLVVFHDEEKETLVQAQTAALEKRLEENEDAAQTVYDIHLETTSGAPICSESADGFNGGKATVTVRHYLPEDVRDLHVFYLNTEGEAEDVPFTRTGLVVEFEAEHFSNYVVSYTAKEKPALSANDYTGTYTGSTVNVNSITGKGAKNDKGETLTGTWSWKDTAPTNVAESGKYTLVFTPDNSDEYSKAEIEINVTINKAKPTGDPGYTKITTNGKTLKDAALNVGSITPDGTIRWAIDENTEVAANKAYDWIFTPSDEFAANYDVSTGTITLWNYNPGLGPGPSVDYNTVRVGTMNNGKVTATPAVATQGRTITLTVTPDEGYVLASLTVTGDGNKTVTLTDLGNGKYSFKMPDSDVRVNATFTKKSVVSDCPRDYTCPIDPFTDTVNDAWWHDGIHYCVERGLMQGYPGNLFGPNDHLSRAQIVTILWRMEGSPVTNYAMSFKDVKAGQWYTEAIRWAQSTGVVLGYSSEAFGPNDDITREQLAAILYRYANYKGIDVSARSDLAQFNDAGKISGWALDNVKWAVEVGMINGTSTTTIAPTDYTNRAQTAAMIQRFCENILGR